MRSFIRRYGLLLLCLGVTALLASCGGGGSGDSDAPIQGSLSVALTDSAAEDYKAVYVTIDRVDVHPGDEDTDAPWTTVATPEKTYNLLELVNGVFAQLGTESLDAGTYTQLRLIIGDEKESGEGIENILGLPHEHANYVIDKDDNEIHELKVPGGPQTGLKIVNGFEIAENQQTEIILDFDATRSVVKAGNSGNYLLKPTIKVLQAINYASIYGNVSDAESAPVAQAYVTAQTDDPAIVAGTLPEENGDFALFVEPGTYNVVATASDYFPGCETVTLEDAASVADPVDFSLVSDSGLPGTVTGTVTIEGEPENQTATIEFLQQINCVNGEPDTWIIVKTEVIAVIENEGTYAVSLPAGVYAVVASSPGHTDVTVEAVTITADTETELENIDLSLTD